MPAAPKPFALRKHKRKEIRATPAEMARLQRAATRDGRSGASFIRTAALAAADRILTVPEKAPHE